MALSAIHNTWLTDLVTVDGEVGFFIPAFGHAIWILAALLFLTWGVKWQEIDWGSRWVLVPLAVLVASMGLSGLSAESWVDKFTPLMMGVFLFSVYLVARNLGVEIFRAFIPFVVLSTGILVVYGITHPGEPNGGLITNYCASVGFLIFGAVVNQGKWQWVLLAVALVGLFFIGALETVFVVGVLGIVLLVRRDWSKWFWVVAGVGAVLVGLWAGLGHLAPLYEGNQNLVALTGLLTGERSWNAETMKLLTTGRWEIIVAAMQDIQWLGHEYSLSTTGGGIVHNIPLIIVHQIGVVGAVAWLLVTVYCLVKTSWKYAWIAVLAMCVFDHYLWTQFVPFWWALVGVSTVSTIEHDRMFRR